MTELNLLKMFSVLGDITNKPTNNTKQDLKKWIAYNERLIFATNGIIKPSNWHTLTDQEKEKRIKKVLTNI